MAETLTDSADEGAKPRLTYSVEEAAKLLGISRNSAFAAAQRGELPSIKIGHRRLIPVRALERFLAELEGSPAMASDENKVGVGAAAATGRSNGNPRT